MMQLIWILLFAVVSSLEIFGQVGIYYYGPNTKPVQSKENAVMFQEVKKRSEKKYTIKTHQIKEGNWIKTRKERIRLQGNGSQRIYYNINTFFPKKIYREMEKINPSEYLFTETNRTNTIRTGTSSIYLPLHLEGMITEYHPNGEIKSISEYQDNQLISNENWRPDGLKYIDSVFYSVDVEPEYQMGDDFFKAYLIKKLEESKLDFTQIEDQVVIGWVVMETGEIDGAIALKGMSSQLNQYLVNTIMELPGYWTPAVLEGKKVRYFMSIPLNFMHKEVNFQEIEFSSNMMHYDLY